tara:strand:+ start:213 stop:350 length:138 start_codon:yes stop_codon:yes gene_type:complete
MQNLTKAQNTIILVALENFLDDSKKQQLEFEAQITELIDIYNNIT